MATIYDLKPKIQNLLRPTVKSLVKAGITANQVTVVSFIISAIAGFMISIWHDFPLVLLVLPVALLIRMALNVIDGMIAHEHHKRTRIGGILNELGDALSDAVLYLPLAYVPGISSAAIVPFVVLAIASEMAGILVKVHGGKRRYDGPLGKYERACVIGLLGLAGGFGIPLLHWVDGLLLLLSALLLLTIANRIRRGLTDISGLGRAPGL